MVETERCLRACSSEERAGCLEHPTPLSQEEDSMSNQNIADHESSGSERRLAARIERAERSIEREQAVGFVEG